MVGGIARTERYKGYRFDVGGHRFFTKVPVVEQLWRSMLGNDLRSTERQSRILYDGRFFAYPLRIGDALRNLGLVESAIAFASYLRAGISPRRPADTFEETLIRSAVESDATVEVDLDDDDEDDMGEVTREFVGVAEDESDWEALFEEAERNVLRELKDKRSA